MQDPQVYGKQAVSATDCRVLYERQTQPTNNIGVFGVMFGVPPLGGPEDELKLELRTRGER